MESSKDNRNLHDRSENQYLSAEEIRMLKSSGATGNEIMTKLVENSSTFHLRTKLSQEKYLKKKKQRYLCVFTVRPFTARVLIDMQCALGRYKSTSLRYDSVVQMLLHANVHAACTVLLAETFSGLLSQAILERLGPRSLGGRLIQFYHGTSPPRLELPNIAEYAKTYAVQFSDVTSLLLTGKLARDHRAASPPTGHVRPLQIDDSLRCCEEEEDGGKEVVVPESSPSPPRAKVPRIEDEQSTLDLHSKPAGADSSPQTLPHAGRRRGRLARLNLTPVELAAAKATALKNRLAELDEARKILCPTEAEASSDLSDRPDCLIVAIRFYPVDITLLLMQFLPPGRPFVVHSHLLAPLVDLYNILKRRGSCAHLTLFDSWLRPIQVLPNRTHPEMKMTSGCGGFLLRGYTVQRLEDDNVLYSQASIAVSARQLFAEGLINYSNTLPVSCTE
uniref:tRNA (adenine(58)-N(1))-methyltransferase non-catalytic subunit TRM6 n=2 Tax=Schistocephalus solidus TaxID=70667 RepID=A0A0X3PVF4_SCHSO